MSDEQNKLLIDLEVRIKQIKLRCDNLNDENMRLKKENKAQQDKIAEINNSLEQLNTKYDNLKIARTVTAASVDVETAKNKLSELVREVDKCIRLLNE